MGDYGAFGDAAGRAIRGRQSVFVGVMRQGGDVIARSSSSVCGNVALQLLPRVKRQTAGLEIMSSEDDVKSVLEGRRCVQQSCPAINCFKEQLFNVSLSLVVFFWTLGAFYY